MNKKSLIAKFTKYIKWIRNSLFKIMSALIYKNKDILVFMSFPDFSDNSKALFEYFTSRYPNKKAVWLSNTRECASQLAKKGYTAEVFNTGKGLYYLLRSGIIATSNLQLIDLKTRNQLYISLWHGMPVKKIGVMEHDKNVSRMRKLYNRVDLLIATSDTTKTLLSASLQIDPAKIVITGQPRCDNLFRSINNGFVHSVLKTNRRVVFFMPTFRQGYLKRDEGRILNINNIFGFEDFKEREFKEFLENNNITLVCKLHPLEESLFIDKFSNDYGYMVLVTNETLLKNDIDLYMLLGTIDLLITDYSSVYFDYLLLNRPIVFTPTDLEEYEKKRGFLLEPYDFWTPGPKATTQDQLQDEILRSLKNPDYYRKERETINNIINHYKDDRSCERITELIMKKLENRERRKNVTKSKIRD